MSQARYASCSASLSRSSTEAARQRASGHFQLQPTVCSKLGSLVAQRSAAERSAAQGSGAQCSAVQLISSAQPSPAATRTCAGRDGSRDPLPLRFIEPLVESSCEQQNTAQRGKRTTQREHGTASERNYRRSGPKRWLSGLTWIGGPCLLRPGEVRVVQPEPLQVVWGGWQGAGKR